MGFGVDIDPIAIDPSPCPLMASIMCAGLIPYIYSWYLYFRYVYGRYIYLRYPNLRYMDPKAFTLLIFLRKALALLAIVKGLVLALACRLISKVLILHNKIIIIKGF